MKITCRLLLPFLFPFITCCAGKEFKKLKEVQEFNFKINNYDSTQFGYRHLEIHMDTGPSSILKYGTNIYITDPFFSNIKAINVETNEILVSPKLSLRWITDVYVNENYVYVVDRVHGLIILTHKMEIVRHINLVKGHKYFIQENKKVYIFFYRKEKQVQEKTAYLVYKLNGIDENQKGIINCLKNTLEVFHHLLTFQILKKK